MIIQALARETLVWSRLKHDNIIPLMGFHLDIEGDAMWLLSKWEPLGNVVGYLASNEVDQAARLQLVRPSHRRLPIFSTQCIS